MFKSNEQIFFVLNLEMGLYLNIISVNLGKRFFKEETRSKINLLLNRRKNKKNCLTVNFEKLTEIKKVKDLSLLILMMLWKHKWMRIMLIMFIQMSFHFSYSTFSLQGMTIFYLKIKSKIDFSYKEKEKIFFSSNVLLF